MLKGEKEKRTKICKMNIYCLKKIRSREIASHPRVVAALKTGVRRWFSLRGFFFTWGCFFLRAVCVGVPYVKRRKREKDKNL